MLKYLKWVNYVKVIKMDVHTTKLAKYVKNNYNARRNIAGNENKWNEIDIMNAWTTLESEIKIKGMSFIIYSHRDD